MCYNQMHRHGGGFRGQHEGYGPWPSKWGKFFGRVPVNIQEKDDRFELWLYAPALQKENIKISVKDEVLMVSYKASEAVSTDASGFTRREYHNESFERSFVLNGKVQVDQISATYTEGILKVTLPKNPETNNPAQNVSVA